MKWYDIQTDRKYDTLHSKYLLPIIKPLCNIDERKQYLYAAHNINRCLRMTICLDAVSRNSGSVHLELR